MFFPCLPRGEEVKAPCILNRVTMKARSRGKRLLCTSYTFYRGELLTLYSIYLAPRQKTLYFLEKLSLSLLLGGFIAYSRQTSFCKTWKSFRPIVQYFVYDEWNAGWTLIKLKPGTRNRVRLYEYFSQCYTSVQIIKIRMTAETARCI